MQSCFMFPFIQQFVQEMLYMCVLNIFSLKIKRYYVTITSLLSVLNFDIGTSSRHGDKTDLCNICYENSFKAQKLQASIDFFTCSIYSYLDQLSKCFIIIINHILSCSMNNNTNKSGYGVCFWQPDHHSDNWNKYINMNSVFFFICIQKYIVFSISKL